MSKQIIQMRSINDPDFVKQFTELITNPEKDKSTIGLMIKQLMATEVKEEFLLDTETETVVEIEKTTPQTPEEVVLKILVDPQEDFTGGGL